MRRLSAPSLPACLPAGDMFWRDAAHVIDGFSECTVILTGFQVLAYFIQPITKTSLFKYIKKSPPKTETFQIKNSDIFHISAQNIDCGYSLESPWRGCSNEYSQSGF